MGYSDLTAIKAQVTPLPYDNYHANNRILHPNKQRTMYTGS